MSFRRSGNLLRPAGAKKGTKGPSALFPHPLSTGSASGRSAAAPLHPWLQSAAPLGRKREKRAGDPFPSSAFHGFRVGPQRGRAAPPVATFHSPVGAETACAGPLRDRACAIREVAGGRGLKPVVRPPEITGWHSPPLGNNMGSVALPVQNALLHGLLHARHLLPRPLRPISVSVLIHDLLKTLFRSFSLVRP